MKRLALLGLYLAFALTPLFAAYQYGDYVNFNGKSLTVTKSGNLTMNFFSPVDQWNSVTVQVTDRLGNVTNKTAQINGNQVSLGDFKEGDSLKFFLDGAQGSTTNAQMWGSGWDQATGQYEYFYIAGNYGQWGQNYIKLPTQITGGPSNPGPVGQPLPGVLTSLALGGVGYTVWRRHRKSAPAA